MVGILPIGVTGRGTPAGTTIVPPGETITAAERGLIGITESKMLAATTRTKIPAAIPRGGLRTSAITTDLRVTTTARITLNPIGIGPHPPKESPCQNMNATNSSLIRLYTQTLRRK